MTFTPYRRPLRAAFVGLGRIYDLNVRAYHVELDLDEDRAKARALVFNPMQLSGMQELSFPGACYHHGLVRTSEGWTSERLVEENLWFVTPPPR